MSLDAILVLGILVGAVALFVSEKYPMDFVALLVLGTLLVLGLVTPQEGLSGFANPATVTVGAMFILSAGLQKTGATAAIGRLMVRFGRNYFSALVVIMLTITVISAFINNTAAVAVFIPLVMIVANRRKIAASRLLIPLSYASQFGGVCTLVGTSTNLLVSSISDEAGYGAFSMFEFSRMGLILFVAGVLFFLIFGRWLLPERQAQELSVTYQLGEYITEMRITETSPLIGKSVLQSRLGEDHDVTVLRLLHVTETVWAPLRQALKAGDVLLVRGKQRGPHARRLCFRPFYDPLDPFYDPLDPFSDPFDTPVFADPPPAPDGPVDLVEVSRRIEILLIGDLLGPVFPVYDTFAEYLDALSPSLVTTGSAPTTNGVVPEPSTEGLLALGTLGVALLRRRSRRAH